MFENYKDCLFNEKTIFKKQQRLKSYYHDMYTEEIYKAALSSNDDKRLQGSQHLYKKHLMLGCENEMVSVRKAKETLKMLRKDCESKLYATCHMFLNYMKAKCGREMKNYVKFDAKKMLSCFARYK